MELSELKDYIQDTPLAVVQEEFLLPDGTFDLNYARYLTKDKKLTKAKLNLAMGDAGFIFKVIPRTNEVSREEFLKEYVYGKYSNVRQWISFMYWKHKKLLTREELFFHILSGQTA